jgi:hypothetical protein
VAIARDLAERYHEGEQYLIEVAHRDIDKGG